MIDLEIVVKALRWEAEWCESDEDRITAEVGYRLRRVAERIEETRQRETDPWTQERST